MEAILFFIPTWNLSAISLPLHQHFLFSIFLKKEHKSWICEVLCPWGVAYIPWWILLFSIFLCTWWPYFWGICLFKSFASVMLGYFCKIHLCKYFSHSVAEFFHLLNSVFFLQISVILIKSDLFFHCQCFYFEF